MSKSSPYDLTGLTRSGTLDVLDIRPVPAYVDDPLYTIEPQYTHCLLYTSPSPRDH